MPALDATHVQQLLVELLEHGYGEVQVRVHEHAITSITLMPLVKHASQVEGIRLGLTDVGTRASVTR